MAALPPPPPRLQGRLTAELVLGSPQGFNAVKDYELDLRGTRSRRGTRGAVLRRPPRRQRAWQPRVRRTHRLPACQP